MDTLPSLSASGVSRRSSIPHQQQQRISAPYGHACTNCAKAKCKCVFSRGSTSVCDRCHRLSRECVPSQTVRKRGSARARSALRSSTGGLGGKDGSKDSDIARTAQLEEKLDDLVSLLRSQASASVAGAMRGTESATAAAAAAAAADAGVGIGAGAGAGVPCDTNGARPHQVPTPESSTSGDAPRLRLKDMYPFSQLASTAVSNSLAPSAVPYQPSEEPAGSKTEIPELTMEEADECLDSFRRHHLKFFPFVYIPPEATAQELQQVNPYLWLNIRALGCKSSVEQSLISQRVREVTGHQVLVRCDRSMDLLLGLLTFVAWGMTHAQGRPIVSTYAGLAMGIVADLRLDKPTHFNPLKESHAFRPYRFTCPLPWLPTERTHEHRRAVLACYIICVNNYFFLKTQTMRWTPHMEECMQKLSDSPQWSGDLVLVALVKIYKVLEDFSHIQWMNSEFGGRSTAASSKPIPIHFVKSLRANIDEIRKSLTPELLENNIVMNYLHATEVQIYDLPLQSSVPSSQPGFVDIARVECFDACLRAAKVALEYYLGFEPSEYIGFPMSFFLNFSRCTQVLYRLSLTDDPGWDRATIRQTVDLIAVLEKAAGRFAAVARDVGLKSDGPDGGDMFTKGANALYSTIPAWKASLEQCGAIPPSDSSASTAGAGTTTAPASGSANSGGDNGNGSSTAAAIASTGNGVNGVGAAGNEIGDTSAGASVYDMQTGFGDTQTFDYMQEYLMMDFVDDTWPTNMLTWQSPT